MTDPQRTLIAVLLDRSGSMESIKTDTEGGFAAFINQQKALDGPAHQAWVTLAQFDTDYEVVYADLPIAQVPALNLQPRGGTALYDALGRIITDVGAELSGQAEELRPGTVIVVVLTDGHENSSVEWTNDAVLKAIKRQEAEFSWDFVFLGANMDAVAVGQSLGFNPSTSITYAASPEGVDAAFTAAGNYVSRRRTAGVDGAVPGFSDEDRRAARAGKD